MAKADFTQEDADLLAELGVEAEAKKVAKRTPREERIIAGFEEIERFWQENGHLPQHGSDKDIFERLYAVRLDRLRESSECREVLKDVDTNGLLDLAPQVVKAPHYELDDDALLDALGVDGEDESDITQLKHVRTRAEKHAASEVANRTRCEDFDTFKPLFKAVQEALKIGSKAGIPFKEDASIQLGQFFIVGGQIAYVAAVGEEIKAPNGEWDARLRVIYDNGTESNILRRSLQRALYKDEAGRRIVDASSGPLFSDESAEGDVTTGTIYVLRSLSDDPYVEQNRDVLHKIGVTGGDIKKRIGNAKNQPTFLMADVEIVATYNLTNINRVKLEQLIHKFFAPARLNVHIKDRFGKSITPREWFLVPLAVIDEAIAKITSGEITQYRYAPEQGKIVPA